MFFFAELNVETAVIGMHAFCSPVYRLLELDLYRYRKCLSFSPFVYRSSSRCGVFRRHRECYDEETVDFDNAHGDPFGFEMLNMTTSVEESKRLNDLKEPAIIISASGMCEGGRIVHHLRNSIENPKNTIVIVGYQAQHTLGRRIVEGRRQVNIFGVPRDLNAKVRVLNAFSAHGDKEELLWWAKSCGSQVRRFFLVHGDPDQCEALSGHIKDLGRKAVVPSPRARVDLLDYEK